MFSSVSAYLFGSGSNVEEYSEKDREYEAVETDGDWLIVEPRESEPKLIIEEGESDDDFETDSIPDWLTSPSPIELNDESDYEDEDERIRRVGKILDCFLIRMKNGGSVVSKQEPVADARPWIIDSWYITPPSCFTQTPNDFIHTSPLENLLIEHPSMSVYARVHKKEYEVACIRNYGINEALKRIQSGITTTRNLPAAHFVERYACDLRRDQQHPSHIPAIAAQYQIHDQVQKAKHCVERKYLHGKQLERHNKSQDFQSVGKRHRRKNFMKNPSGKSNNRKY